MGEGVAGARTVLAGWTRRTRRTPVALLPAGVATATEPSPRTGSGSVLGTVSGSGAPVPFATVHLVPVRRAGAAAALPPLVARTDGRGRYAFTDLPPMAVQVRARAPLGSGLADAAWPQAPTLAGAGVLEVGAGPVRADLELPAGGAVAGTVLDASSGAAVPGATVTVAASTEGVVEEVGTPLTVGVPGGFRITGLPPIPLELVVRLPSGSAHLGPWFWPEDDPRRAALRVDGTRTTEALTVRLDRGAELRGTVRDAGGAPVARALVGVEGCAVSCPVAVPTDAEGRYRMTGIPPGEGLTVSTWLGTGEEYRLWLGGARTRDEAPRLSLAPGAVRAGLDLQLPRGAELRLRVLGLSGSPLRAVVAQLVPEPGSGGGGYGPRRNIAVRDPQDPTRRLIGPVPPGRYTLAILSTESSRLCRTTGWEDSTGIGRDGRLTLDAGAQVDVQVQLACTLRWPASAAPDAEPAPEQAARRAPCSGAGDGQGSSDWPWPEPGAGFLELPAWASPTAGPPA